MSQNFLKELTQYFENNTALTIGTDLFAVAIPQSQTADCTLVRSTGGISEVNGLNQFAAQVQIFTRAKNPMDSNDANHVIYDLLNVRGQITLPVVVSGRSFVINSSRPWTMPQSVGQDEKGRYQYTSNWTIQLQGS